MKKLLLLSFSFFILNVTQGQSTWFNNDAVWHYGGGDIYHNGYKKLVYEKDSVYAGHIWKVFTHTFTGIYMYPTPGPFSTVTYPPRFPARHPEHTALPYSINTVYRYHLRFKHGTRA